MAPCERGYVKWWAGRHWCYAGLSSIDW
jgi:hypothetical protein